MRFENAQALCHSYKELQSPFVIGFVNIKQNLRDWNRQERQSQQRIHNIGAPMSRQLKTTPIIERAQVIANSQSSTKYHQFRDAADQFVAYQVRSSRSKKETPKSLLAQSLGTCGSSFQKIADIVGSWVQDQIQEVDKQFHKQEEIEKRYNKIHSSVRTIITNNFQHRIRNSLSNELVSGSSNNRITQLNSRTTKLTFESAFGQQVLAIHEKLNGAISIENINTVLKALFDRVGDEFSAFECLAINGVSTYIKQRIEDETIKEMPIKAMRDWREIHKQLVVPLFERLTRPPNPSKRQSDETTQFKEFMWKNFEADITTYQSSWHTFDLWGHLITNEKEFGSRFRPIVATIER